MSDAGVDLRNHVLPALRAYGVDSVEVAYSTGAAPRLEGIQFRDPSNRRISRTSIPFRLTGRLESCVSTYFPGPDLGKGSGVVTLFLSNGQVVRQHQAIDGQGVDAHDEWQL